MNGSTTTALRLVPVPADHPSVEILPRVHVEPVAEPGEQASARGRGHLQLVPERGMATAEYAVGLIAACAFAFVLYKLVTGNVVFQLLTALAQSAMKVFAH